jgi:hypothetical protein
MHYVHKEIINLNNKVLIGKVTKSTPMIAPDNPPMNPMTDKTAA